MNNEAKIGIIKQNTDSYIVQKNKTKDDICGTALINGIILKNSTYETICELNSQQNIVLQTNQVSNTTNKKMNISNIPIIRGIICLINNISSVIPCIITSAQDFMHAKAINNKDESFENDITFNKFTTVCSFCITIVIIISLFILIPNLISTYFPWNYQNIVQCVILVTTFFIYFLAIARSNTLQNLLEYHGAEHKVINAYEKLEKNDITFENVKKQSRFHVHCSSNFLVYICILVIITTLVLPSYNILIKTLIQVTLLPILVGIAYEILTLIDSLPNTLKFLAYPAMAIQYVTTKEPTDEKIQLATNALLAIISGSDNEKH